MDTLSLYYCTFTILKSSWLVANKEKTRDVGQGLDIRKRTRLVCVMKTRREVSGWSYQTLLMCQAYKTENSSTDSVTFKRMISRIR